MNKWRFWMGHDPYFGDMTQIRLGIWDRVPSEIGSCPSKSPGVTWRGIGEQARGFHQESKRNGEASRYSKESDRGRHRRSLCTTPRTTDRVFRSEDREDPLLQPVTGGSPGLGFTETPSVRPGPALCDGGPFGSGYAGLGRSIDSTSSLIPS